MEIWRDRLVISPYYFGIKGKEVIIIAYMVQAKTEDELKGITLVNLRKEYNKLAEDYNKIMNLEVIYCPICNSFKAASQFYTSKKTKSGLKHCGCKSCLLDLATDVNQKTKTRTDNREKTIKVFKMLDMPFVDSVYKSQLQLLADDVAEKQRSTAYQSTLVVISSLPQYRDKDFSFSEFDIDSDQALEKEDTKIIQKTLKSAKKRFGTDYNQEELMFLENEYQDWVNRYECSTKSQEDIFENLSVNKLLQRKALKEGKSTKDLDKQRQDWLDAGALKPKQNSSNGLSDSLTFGQLIERWEEEKPIPEPSEEFKDVDGIGKYIRVWFKGHLCRAFGLDNGYSKEYDDYIKQYTVTKPEYEDDGKSEGIYSTLFGKDDD